MLKYIITGTGRCGTVAMAKVFNSLGISCGHESIFGPVSKEEVVSRLSGNSPPVISEVFQLIKDDVRPNLESLEADSSYMAAPYLDLVPDAKIIHLVRHPLKVISSFVFDFLYFKEYKHNEYEQWIYSHAPFLLDVSPGIDRACAYYIYWNNLIEEKCIDRQCYIHRIEDEFDSLFFDFVGVRYSEQIYKNKLVNSFRPKRKDIIIDQIEDINIQNDIIKIGHRYGYSFKI